MKQSTRLKEGVLSSAHGDREAVGYSSLGKTQSVTERGVTTAGTHQAMGLDHTNVSNGARVPICNSIDDG